MSEKTRAAIKAYEGKIPHGIEMTVIFTVLETLSNNPLFAADNPALHVAFKGAIARRDVKGLIEAADLCVPQLYRDYQSYSLDCQISNLFSKYEFRDSPFDKKRKARARFDEAEAMCLNTNIRLRQTRCSALSPRGRFIDTVIEGAKRDIANLLGEVPVGDLEHKVRHGPGSCLGVNGNATSMFHKLVTAQWTTTDGALPYALAFINRSNAMKKLVAGVPLGTSEDVPEYAEGRREFQVAEHNKITFVPKNAKTDRSIAIEPMWNVAFQLAFGSIIRNRLKRWGIDLNSQERNQKLAREGSISGSVATIDLSMASDTLAYEVVKEFLPEDWFLHLSALRSATGKDGSKIRRYEKFSSMGNGYTFELESLVFTAVCRQIARQSGVDPRRVSVYGDDIIVPSEMAADVLTALRWLGFKPNDEKTYLSGPFRESCGEDFFEGTPVRPLFQKERLCTRAELVALHNRLYIAGGGGDVHPALDPWFSRACDYVLSHLPAAITESLNGPPGDDVRGHLFRPTDQLLGRGWLRWSKDLHCNTYATIVATPRQFPQDLRVPGGEDAWWVSLLWAISQEGNETVGEVRREAQRVAAMISGLGVKPQLAPVRRDAVRNRVKKLPLWHAQGTGLTARQLMSLLLTLRPIEDWTERLLAKTELVDPRSIPWEDYNYVFQTGHKPANA